MVRAATTKTANARRDRQLRVTRIKSQIGEKATKARDAAWIPSNGPHSGSVEHALMNEAGIQSTSAARTERVATVIAGRPGRLSLGGSQPTLTVAPVD